MFSLDDRICAVLHQIGHQQVRDALTHINVLPEDLRHITVYRRIIEVHDRHALLAPLPRRRHRRSHHQHPNHQPNPNSFHNARLGKSYEKSTHTLLWRESIANAPGLSVMNHWLIETLVASTF